MKMSLRDAWEGTPLTVISRYISSIHFTGRVDDSLLQCALTPFLKDTKSYLSTVSSHCFDQFPTHLRTQGFQH